MVEATYTKGSHVCWLRSFLGLLHCYGKFMASLSSLLHLLNQLLKAHSPWKWSQKCENVLWQTPVLAHYDTIKKLKLTKDASAYVCCRCCDFSYKWWWMWKAKSVPFKNTVRCKKYYAQIDKGVFNWLWYPLVPYGQRFSCTCNQPQDLGFAVWSQKGYSY